MPLTPSLARRGVQRFASVTEPFAPSNGPCSWAVYRGAGLKTLTSVPSVNDFALPLGSNIESLLPM
jgi:hypothetical protein